MPKILLVDDEPRVLRSLTAALELNHDIYTSESAHGAQAVIKAGEQFDAIISDQIMPEMKGHELLNWCRLNSPNSRRIMLTGVPVTNELKQQIDDLASVDIFRKPWNIEEINNRLNSEPNKAFVTPKESQTDISATDSKVIVLESSEYYQALCSDLAPSYFNTVIQCATRQKLLQAVVEHDDVKQIIVSLPDGSPKGLDFLERLHETCPEANILITAEPRTIRDLQNLGSKSSHYSALIKPFSIKRLANIVVGAH